MKSTSNSVKISVKTGIRLEYAGGDYDEVPTVDLHIGGRVFRMDCDSEEHARQQVIEVVRDLGIPL